MIKRRNINYINLKERWNFTSNTSRIKRFANSVGLTRNSHKDITRRFRAVVTLIKKFDDGKP